MKSETFRPQSSENGNGYPEGAIEVKKAKNWSEVSSPGELTGILKENLGLLSSTDWGIVKDKVFIPYNVTVDQVERVDDAMIPKVFSLILEFTDPKADKSLREDIAEDIANTIQGKSGWDSK